MNSKLDLDFEKDGGLVPAIVQDANTGTVLMLGYMNREALEKTEREGRVTFFSRSKKRLWTKGESSGNFLEVTEIFRDCDGDALLIKALPKGPVCHTGADTCFSELNQCAAGILAELCRVIKERKRSPLSASYTSHLFAEGPNAILQKVGEEAVELIIAAKDTEQRRFLEEAADLLFHYLVLLEERGSALEEVLQVLRERRR